MEPPFSGSDASVSGSARLPRIKGYQRTVAARSTPHSEASSRGLEYFLGHYTPVGQEAVMPNFSGAAGHACVTCMHFVLLQCIANAIHWGLSCLTAPQLLRFIVWA